MKNHARIALLLSILLLAACGQKGPLRPADAPEKQGSAVAREAARA